MVGLGCSSSARAVIEVRPFPVEVDPLQIKLTELSRLLTRVRFRRKRHYLCLPLTNQIQYSSALRLCSGKQQRTLCPLFRYHWRQSAMPFGSKLDFAYECDQRPVAARWSDHLHADWKAVLIEAGGQRDCRQP